LDITVKIPLIGIRFRLTNKSIKCYAFISFYEFYYYRIPKLILALLLGALPGLCLYYLGIIHNLLNYFNSSNPSVLPSIIWIIGIAFATVGWIVTVISLQRISCKQHTVDLLVNHNFSQIHRAHVNTILSKYPDDKCISRDEAKKLITCREELISEKDDKKKEKLNDTKGIFVSLVTLLNYYEFIAMGLKHGDLDSRLIHDYFHSSLCSFCEKSRGYISARRKHNEDDTLYENLIDVYRTWKPSGTFPEL